jgi:hypothetical protein
MGGARARPSSMAKEEKQVFKNTNNQEQNKNKNKNKKERGFFFFQAPHKVPSKVPWQGTL